MPRIWTDYCQFLLDQCFITRTRKACDRALRSLPITQHHRVWPIYLKLIETYDIPDTGVKVYKRYSKVKFMRSIFLQLQLQLQTIDSKIFFIFTANA